MGLVPCMNKDCRYFYHGTCDTKARDLGNGICNEHLNHMKSFLYDEEGNYDIQKIDYAGVRKARKESEEE